jgi:hypothetical protein
MIILILTWLRRNIVPALIGLIVLMVAIWFGFHEFSKSRTAGQQAELNKGQTDAAIKSGQDAVNTFGNEQAREGTIHDDVRTGTDEIGKAAGGNSNDAADRAACSMRTYRHTSKCVALLGPAPE